MVAMLAKALLFDELSDFLATRVSPSTGARAQPKLNCTLKCSINVAPGFCWLAFPLNHACTLYSVSFIQIPVLD